MSIFWQVFFAVVFAISLVRLITECPLGDIVWLWEHRERKTKR